MKKILLIAPLALSLLLASCNGNEKSGDNSGSGDNPTSQTTGTTGGSTPSSGDPTSGDPTSTTQVTPVSPTITKVAWHNINTGSITLDNGAEQIVQANVSGTPGRDENGNTIAYDHSSSFSTEQTDIVELTPMDPLSANGGSRCKIRAKHVGTAYVVATANGDDSKTVTLTVNVQSDGTVAAIISVTTHPDTVFLGKEIKADTVGLKVRLDDNTEVDNYRPSRVACDTATPGVKTATAIIDLDDELFLSTTFEVEVLDVAETKALFTSASFATENNIFDSSNDNTHSKAGNNFDSSGSIETGKRGVQVTYGNSAFTTSNASYTHIVGFEVVYSSNGATGNITVSVGGVNKFQINNNGGSLTNEHAIQMFDTEIAGDVKLSINNTGTSKSLYVQSISIIQNRVQEGIEVLTPGKVEYAYGETFDLSGYVVVPKYNVGQATAAEAIDHSNLSVSPNRELTAEDTEVTISLNESAYSVTQAITVVETLPSYINVSFDDSIYDVIDEGNKQFNLEIGNAYDFATTITVDPSASRKEYIFDSENACATFDDSTNTLAIDVSTLTDEVDFDITFKYVNTPTVKETYKVHVIDSSQPHLSEVVVSGTPSAPEQYEGETLNPAGLTFTANYTNGGASVSLTAEDITLPTLVYGEDIVCSYEDANGDSVEFTVTGITILQDAISGLVIEGSLANDSYEVGEYVSAAGLVVYAEYHARERENVTTEVTWTYNDENSLQLNDAGNISVTFKASYSGEEASVTYGIIVSDQQTLEYDFSQISGFDTWTATYANDHEVEYTDATVKFCGSARQTTTITDVPIVKGTDVIFKLKDTTKSITEFELTCRQWNDKAKTMKAYPSTDSGESYGTSIASTTVSNSTTGTTFKVSKNSGIADGVNALKFNAGVSGDTGYSNNVGIVSLKVVLGEATPAKQVTEITSIEGGVTAHLNHPWDTSAIVVKGKFEGDSVSSVITDLVDLDISPATATSMDLEEVSVTATLTSDNTKTLTNEHVAATVEASTSQEVTYTFTNKSWTDSTNSWVSDNDGGQLSSGKGVQVTATYSGAGAHTNASFYGVSKIVFTYCTNKSSGTGAINVQIGENTAISQSVNSTGGTTLRTMEFVIDPSQTGVITFSVDCSENSIYISSIAVTSLV
ncbi:MAG: hypothetical protein K6E11_04290 [Bacilli bacterium]|nr:hypothetical protein [Bacilli bacterium]